MLGKDPDVPNWVHSSQDKDMARPAGIPGSISFCNDKMQYMLRSSFPLAPSRPIKVKYFPFDLTPSSCRVLQVAGTQVPRRPVVPLSHSRHTLSLLTVGPAASSSPAPHSAATFGSAAATGARRHPETTSEARPPSTAGQRKKDAHASLRGASCAPGRFSHGSKRHKRQHIA